jgi:hypothetical protein
LDRREREAQRQQKSKEREGDARKGAELGHFP